MDGIKSRRGDIFIVQGSVYFIGWDISFCWGIRSCYVFFVIGNWTLVALLGCSILNGTGVSLPEIAQQFDFY
jgi:hypothetical protein